MAKVALSLMFGWWDNVLELIWNTFETSMSAAGSAANSLLHLSF